MEKEMKDSGIEWIGKIPAKWGINTVFQLFIQVKNKNTELQEQNLLSLSYGKIKRKNIDTTDGLLPESFDGYNIIEAGDIVLRLTDLQNDHKSLRVGLATERGIVTSAYLTVRNRSESLPKYLYYYLYSFDIAKGFYGMGSGVRQGLNWDGIKWLKILTPTVPEQQRIVAFLDTECDRIDAVIERTKASIEEYKRLKQSVITESVIKGIHDNRSVKRSTVDYIDTIPEEWKEIRNSFLFRENVRKPRVDSPSLSLSQADGLILTDNMKERSLKTSSFDGWKRVEIDDLVLNRFKAHLGVFFAATVEGMVSFHYGVYEPVMEVNSKYYEYLFHSDVYRGIYSYKSNGMTVGLQNLSNQSFYDVKSLYPPVEEQDEIAHFIDKKVAEIDSLIQKKEMLILELDAYKKAVIYEYVTGKKEVPA